MQDIVTVDFHDRIICLANHDRRNVFFDDDPRENLTVMVFNLVLDVVTVNRRIWNHDIAKKLRLGLGTRVGNIGANLISEISQLMATGTRFFKDTFTKLRVGFHFDRWQKLFQRGIPIGGNFDN